MQGASTILGGPGALLLSGAVGGLGNGLMQGLSGNALAAQAGIGAASGLLGGVAAQGAGQLVGDIASPLVDGLVKGAVGGTVGGFIGGGVASSLMGGNFWDGAIQGAWQGAAYGAAIGGAVKSYQALKEGFNPLTGQRTKSWLAKNTLPTLEPKRPDLTIGEIEKRQIRGNIWDADFDQALSEWNNVRGQYGLDPIPADQAYNGNSFKPITLPDGSRVQGRFYYGGRTNPTGWNIKVNMYAPANQPKLPPVHLRYLNIPR